MYFLIVKNISVKSFKTFQLTLLKVARHCSLDISWENCQKVLLNVLCSHTYTYKPVTRFENVFEWKTTCFLLQNGIVSCWSLVCSFVLNNLLVPPFLGDKKEKKEMYLFHAYSCWIPCTQCCYNSTGKFFFSHAFTELLREHPLVPLGLI